MSWSSQSSLSLTASQYQVPIRPADKANSYRRVPMVPGADPELLVEGSSTDSSFRSDLPIMTSEAMLGDGSSQRRDSECARANRGRRQRHNVGARASQGARHWRVPGPRPQAAEVELDDALAALYALAPAEFVTRRDTIVAELRLSNHLALADQVQALRKPSLAAWSLNLLARSRPTEL